MRTDAPGPFSCEIYIKSWELGYREGSTREHIDNCSFCGPLVHGGTKEFPLSAAEQAKKNIADRKKQSRRSFLKKTAIAASILTASLVGFDQWRGAAESNLPKTIHTELAADFATLDSAYATFGRGKIESFVNGENASITNRTYRWIQSRGHSGMYDLICAGLSDHRDRVCYAAYTVLQRIDPVDLKAHKDVISVAERETPFENLKTHIGNLLAAIEAS